PGFAISLILVLVGLWLRVGRGPRRSGGYRRAQRLLRQGQWREALAVIGELQQGNNSKFWQGRLRNAEGECYRTAGVQAVQAKQFEMALDHHLRGAELLNITPAEVRASLIERMLSEVRELFATTTGSDTAAVHEMAARVLAVQPVSPEASFWQALCFIREGKLDLAQQA